MRLTVEALIEDQGTVVVLSGRDDTGRLFTFAADHRPAQAIVDALEAGESVACEIDSWAILSHVPEVATVEERLTSAGVDSQVAGFRDELDRLPTANRGAPT